MTSPVSKSPLRKRLDFLMKDKLFLLCFAGSIFIFIGSLVAPYFLNSSPYEIHEGFLTAPPVWMEGGSFRFPLGTDDLGRDLTARLIAGGKISLLTGLAVMLLSLIAGLVFGALSGLLKKWDPYIMGAVDIFMSFPGLLTAVVVMAVLGPGLLNACIAASLMCAPLMIRLVRSLVLRELGRQYVEAGRGFGAGFPRLTFRHILPNCLGEISVQSVLNFSEGILTVAALSFLGLGAKPPLPEWGVMISDGRAYIQTEWWLTCFPGLCILILVLCVNIIGERLRDAFDPKLLSE